MTLSIKRLLRSLPSPVLGKLRFVRDQIAMRTFRTRIVQHAYGGIELRVKLADKMSALWYDRNFDELPEISFLKDKRLKNGALVFDLGAHQGVIALLLARIVGQSGRVIAVEAGKYNFDLAIENKFLNGAENLSVVRSVVAPESGVLTAFSGGINGSVSSAGEAVVSCSIDSLAAEFGTPDVVVLDLEGYECRALEGGTQTLKSGANWCVEVHAGCGLESFGGSSEQVAKIFRDYGYDLYCQTDEYCRGEFRPMSAIPEGRFFLIAIKG
jgi:FkbM family methyltransferase